MNFSHAVGGAASLAFKKPDREEPCADPSHKGQSWTRLILGLGRACGDLGEASGGLLMFCPLV